jgi:hypothetical protein
MVVYESRPANETGLGAVACVICISCALLTGDAVTKKYDALLTLLRLSRARLAFAVFCALGISTLSILVVAFFATRSKIPGSSLYLFSSGLTAMAVLLSGDTHMKVRHWQ